MPNQKQSVFGPRARSKPRKELAKLKGNYNYALFAVSPRLDPGLQARVKARSIFGPVKKVYVLMSSRSLAHDEHRKP